MSARELGVSPKEDNQPIQSGLAEGPNLLPCCEQTVRLHAAFNPMMVCQDCKQIIKCFREEIPFSNYLTFCKSRNRKVHSSQVDDLYVIVFRSYDAFTS